MFISIGDTVLSSLSHRERTGTLERQTLPPNTVGIHLTLIVRHHRVLSATSAAMHAEHADHNALSHFLSCRR